MSKEQYTNRLYKEKSPYLLQHAHNPVDWFPWGEEAFEKAKREDKPIFLSIGYSTCHWCHVMEAESFEDLEVAEVLNQDYIAIKVDKEERPDIDMVYMNVCQIITGQGGWPNTIVMTSDQMPFFAGTYFPKKQTQGRIGLIELLGKISLLWKEKRGDLLNSAEQIHGILQRNGKQTIEATEESPEDSPEDAKSDQDADTEDQNLVNQLLDDAKRYYVDQFDERYGGFGKSPKFPSPHNLLLLLALYEKRGDGRALEMAESTLKQMHRGGLYDHIGGGFARYSTDRQWLVPHFEKMLYDNALLLMAYTKAYELTKDEGYHQVVTETVGYLLKEMKHPSGGFYSAQDADSEGLEGSFYLFRPEEVLEVLGEEDGKSFCRFYDITESGNFEGSNIPNLLANSIDILPPPSVLAQKKKLYEYRAARMALRKDDKILTAWNGLAIVALSRVYKVFLDRQALDGAEQAVSFMQKHLTRKEDRLRVRYRDRESVGLGYLDDYAFYVWGLIELYEATHKVSYLQSALDYNNRMLQDFLDEENGGFFFTSNESETLIFRPKETYDGAIPSGNSVAALNLISLGRRMNSEELDSNARQQLRFLGKSAMAHPAGHSMGLLAMGTYWEFKD